MIDEPDTHAGMRAEFRKLTPEAQEDEWLGLQLDLKDEKAAHEKTKAKLKGASDNLKDLTLGEKYEVIRCLQSKVKNANNQKWKALEDRDAYHKQVYALKKRLGEAEKRLIAINNVGVAY